MNGWVKVSHKLRVLELPYGEGHAVIRQSDETHLWHVRVERHTVNEYLGRSDGLIFAENAVADYLYKE